MGIEGLDQYLSIYEVAKLYDATPKTIKRWVTQGKFPKPVPAVKGVSRWRIADIRKAQEDALRQAIKDEITSAQTGSKLPKPAQMERPS